ncbi:MAG: hypothetical protein V8S74_06470 [Lachnospirales bacterium]
MEQEKQSDVNIKQLEEISYKAAERMIETLEDKASINENININYEQKLKKLQKKQKYLCCISVSLAVLSIMLSIISIIIEYYFL